MVGLTPVLLRDRASESILVPIQFALLAAGVHLDRWLSESGRTHALGALAWGALALHGRPEAWIVVPILGLGWCLMDARLSRLRRGRAAWAGLLFALVVAPRAWSLYEYVGAASRHGDVPGLEGGGDLAGIFERLQTLNLLVSPHLHAVSLTVAALAALVVIRRSRLGAVSLVGGAVGIWIVLSTLDLPAVSVPRVQAPAVLFAGIMASVTVGALAQGPETWRRLAAMVALGLMLVPSPQVIDTLWAKTNAQSFDAWWDRAMESLPSAEAERCVVALSMSDPPQDVVLRHLPLYELPNLGVDGASLSISTFLETPASVLSTSCEALYVEGPQCYARSFDPQGPQPERAERLPICQRMHREWALAPIHVEDVPNEGNADFPFYGASPTLRYGLYRIVHLDPTNTGPRKVRPRSAP